MLRKVFKKLKVKKVQRKRLAKNKKAFLIFRYYPDLKIKEYIVCINYSRRTNCYKDGLIMERLDQAYNVFNGLVNNGSFEFIKNRKSNYNDLDDIDNMGDDDDID